MTRTSAEDKLVADLLTLQWRLRGGSTGMYVSDDDAPLYLVRVCDPEDGFEHDFKDPHSRVKIWISNPDGDEVTATVFAPELVEIHEGLRRQECAETIALMREMLILPS